jgi:N-acetylglucosaminyldiphosphoundecaprenol N-acetyl-beta-D-mannosaminyltransferase
MQFGFVNILGVRIAAIDYERAMAALERFMADGRTHYVCLSNVHMVAESQFDAELKQAVNAADLALPDGMPLVWAANREGHRLPDRVYGPELMLRFCARSAERGYRHFFYGGAPGVADDLAARLKRRFPGIRIAGSYSPPFRPLDEDEECELAERVNDQVDVLWIGLGCPKQEKWMSAHRHLRVGVMVGVGAAFDFHTGRVAQAPRWMQRRGLEWLFRLSREPRRLWRRNLVHNPVFVWLYLCQQLGLRKFEVTGRSPESGVRSPESEALS